MNNVSELVEPTVIDSSNLHQVQLNTKVLTIMALCLDITSKTELAGFFHYSGSSNMLSVTVRPSKSPNESRQIHSSYYFLDELSPLSNHAKILLNLEREIQKLNALFHNYSSTQTAA